jgi:hypothetical protein
MSWPSGFSTSSEPSHTYQPRDPTLPLVRVRAALLQIRHSGARFIAILAPGLVAHAAVPSGVERRTSGKPATTRNSCFTETGVELAIGQIESRTR